MNDSIFEDKDYQTDREMWAKYKDLTVHQL